jgi:hypothetical protein
VSTTSNNLAAAVLTWVEDRGVVLQSARGPVENVAQFVAGEPIRGSWWGHRSGKEIYEILNLLDASEHIVTTRLLNKKVTLIPARVWPAIVRVSALLGIERLTALHQEHTKSGAHRTLEVAFPLWVPSSVIEQAAQPSVDEAFAELPDCLNAS